MEACVYREAFAGRIAAYYHNNKRLFGSGKFTLVPRQAYRGEVDIYALEELQTIRDVCGEVQNFRGVTSRSRQSGDVSLSRKCAEEGLYKVIQLTYLQAEDPTWFLLRAFSFTSRTTHGFLCDIYREFERNMAGLSHTLAAQLPFYSVSLPHEQGATATVLTGMYDAVADALGIRKRSRQAVQCTPQERARKLKALSDGDIDGLTKNAINELLTSLGQRVNLRSSKQALMVQLRTFRDDLNTGRAHPPHDDDDNSYADPSAALAALLM